MKDAPDDINTFSESEAIDLPSAVLQLLDEVESLKNKIASLERIIEIYISPDPRVIDITHVDCAILAEAAKRRTEAAKGHPSKLLDLEDAVESLDARMSQIKPVKTPGKKTEDRKLKLAIHLMNHKNVPMRFNDVGKMLELGSRSANGKQNTRKQNMNLFGKYLEQDKKSFVVTKSNTSRGRLVSLTKDYYQHLIRKYIGGE